MLHDVRIRVLDVTRRIELHEIITVDADSGDAAAEMAQAIRPGAVVVGVGPKGQFTNDMQGRPMEGEDNPVDDEDMEPGPSKRELEMMQPKRGPGRPRKDTAA